MQGIAEPLEYLLHIGTTYWKTILTVMALCFVGVGLVVWALSAYLPLTILIVMGGLVAGWLYSSITIKLICKAEGVEWPPRFN